MLDHERLDVYQAAIRFLGIAFHIADGVPRGHAALVDQLRRAATSVPLNIAEAAGKPAAADRARFYAIARGSAMECGAVLDVAALLAVVEPARVREAKELLVRTVRMLSKMCR